MHTFPELIKLIRNKAGLTQSELAGVLDVSPVLIAMVESGQREISKNLIVRLAEKLEVHPSSITPFIFINNDESLRDLPKMEKSLISVGQKLQSYLINNRAKKLKEYVI